MVYSPLVELVACLRQTLGFALLTVFRLYGVSVIDSRIMGPLGISWYVAV